MEISYGDNLQTNNIAFRIHQKVIYSKKFLFSYLFGT